MSYQYLPSIKASVSTTRSAWHSEDPPAEEDPVALLGSRTTAEELPVVWGSPLPLVDSVLPSNLRISLRSRTAPLSRANAARRSRSAFLASSCAFCTSVRAWSAATLARSSKFRRSRSFSSANCRAASRARANSRFAESRSFCAAWHALLHQVSTACHAAQRMPTITNAAAPYTASLIKSSIYANSRICTTSPLTACTPQTHSRPFQ